MQRIEHPHKKERNLNEVGKRDGAITSAIQGKVQEEELDSGAQPASGGRDKRMRVAGRNRHGFSLRDFSNKNRGTADCCPSVEE
jgi:hypothetical protein